MENNNSQQQQNNNSNNNNNEQPPFARERAETFTEVSQRKQQYFKAACVGITLCVFIWINLVPAMSLVQVECVDDYLQDYTQSINTYFAENPNTKNALLITCGVLSDLLAVTQFALWSIKGGTWRFPIALVMLYILRFLCASLWKIRYPEGYLWEYPGFYSLTIPYGKANDFYFAAHVGMFVIIFHELLANKHSILAVITFFIIAFQIMLSISLRGNYMIDIFGAIVFGHFTWVQGQNFSYWIDVRVFGLTFQERFPFFQKECSNCKYPINKWTNNKMPIVPQTSSEAAQYLRKSQEQQNE